jgi:xanthine dehydrogenase accessory factor
MKELQAILKAVSGFENNQKAILATVVALEGSGYRRPGARMLIDENGFSIGTVSGGCLEADVLERAKKVLETGESTVITYDTRQDENSVFGLGMGCRGVIRILLESISKESDIFKSLEFAYENKQQLLIATLIAGESNVNIGGRIYYDKIQQFDFVYLPNSFENLEELEVDCLKVFSGEIRSLVKTYETDKGKAEFFIEKIELPLNLLLFGAGFDAIPLTDFAKNLGWLVTIIDHRSASANTEKFPNADEIIIARPENLDGKLFQDANSVAVLMTHNYDRDKELLPLLLKSKALYVGALGPKRRVERLLDEIDETFSEEQLKRLYAPIGLDIGAETPEEIALSIVAEIRGVLADRNGGFLRERQGSIYARS